jgi:hypothetical protein
MSKEKLDDLNRDNGMKNGEQERPKLLLQLWRKNIYRISEMGDLTSMGKRQCCFCDEMVPKADEELIYSFVLASKDGYKYFVCYKCMARIRGIISQQVMINPPIWDIEQFYNPFISYDSEDRKALDKRLVDSDTLDRLEYILLELDLRDLDVDMVFWKKETSKEEDLKFRKYIRDLIDEIDRKK